jgi:hypothetical protein
MASLPVIDGKPRWQQCRDAQGYPK